MGISKKMLIYLNYPNFKEYNNGDVAQKITDIVIEKKLNTIFWFPSDIEELKWNLYHHEHKYFGLGTTYEGLVYHAFDSRFSNVLRFVSKCKKVLQES